MPSYAGGKVRVAIKRLNLRRLPISSHSHETRSTTHNNFRGVYVAFGDRLSYGAGLPFHVRWDRIQRNLALLGRVSAGNTVVPYRESGEAFRAMWAAVDGARQSVLWQTYICKDDRVGRMTVKKMEAAHTRGCRTELLFDCGGNITGRRRLTEKLKESGATVIEHRPVFDQILPYFLGGMKWERSPGIRNHRKILLVDSEIGFCGGLNIGNEYCGRTQGGTGRFRDTHCSVVGPAVAHLREVYDDTKAPKPWKWGWTRWHKIAAAAMNLRYKEGKNATNDILLPMTQSMQEKGSMYLHRQMEKAEQNTARFMERIRWKRQRERLESFMRWYPKNRKMTNKGNGIEGRHNPDDEPKSGLQSIDNNINNSNNNNIIINNNINNSNKDVTPSTTMKEKIERYRVRPFNTVKVAFKKRLGRKVPPVSPPLSDTDPVPGAEQYSTTRPNVTQILCCNPHSRDWSIPYAFWRVSQKAYGRLWVTTPYYMPHRKLLHALLHAARRGVDVRILAGSNYTTDPWFMWYASNYITERLLAAGVRVYEYKGGQVMHAKTVVVDSIWCSVGSYNWDMMSNKNMEVCLCHLSYELAREMERHFIQDLQVSKELKYDEYRCRSLWLRFASWFFYIGLQILEKLAFHTYRNEDLSSEVDDLD